MKTIGLTGGIGTGKSTVSRYLTTKGYKIIDADQIAREVVEPGRPALALLVGEFGPEILLEDGSLNRRELARLAFASPERKAILDRITHGAIFARIEELQAQYAAELEATADAVIFLDVPLLFETGFDRKADLVWVVDVPDEIRVKRVVLRDGLTEEEIWARIKNQMSREEKIARADVVLDNSGTPEELYAQINLALTELTGGVGR